MFSGNGKKLHAGLTIAIVASIWLSIAAGNAVSEAGVLANIPSTISVEMWELQPNGNRSGQRCINYSGVRSNNWGCTAYCSQVSPYPCTNPAIHPPPVPKPSGQSAWVYPFTSNQVTVEIDGSAAYNGYTYNRYLRDVVPQETHPEAFAAKAVTAQAIAARTYAYNRGGAGVIDNSAGYQVYVPFRYDSMKRNYADFRPVIDAAVQRQVYLSPDGNANRDPIDAQYFDDRPAATLSGASANLVAVPDPVSQSSCGSYASGNGVGFSQKGASRWALGNPQYNPNNSPCAPWSVAWRHPFQILVHYYTDVDIWDRAGYAQAPDQRWNALQISNLPPAIVQPGSTHTLDVFVQNTGVAAWDTSYALSYWLCQPNGNCANDDGAQRVQIVNPLAPAWTNPVAERPPYLFPCLLARTSHHLAGYAHILGLVQHGRLVLARHLGLHRQLHQALPAHPAPRVYPAEPLTPSRSTPVVPSQPPGGRPGVATILMQGAFGPGLMYDVSTIVY